MDTTERDTDPLVEDNNALRAAVREYFDADANHKTVAASHPIGVGTLSEEWSRYYDRKGVARARLDAATVRLKALAG